MLIPRKQLVLSIILEHQKEMKHIDEWMELINNSMPEPKRLTRRSMTQVIGILGRSGYVILKRERIRKNTFYEFKENDDKSYIMEQSHIPESNIKEDI